MDRFLNCKDLVELFCLSSRVINHEKNTPQATSSSFFTRFFAMGFLFLYNPIFSVLPSRGVFAFVSIREVTNCIEISLTQMQNSPCPPTSAFKY